MYTRYNSSYINSNSNKYNHTEDNMENISNRLMEVCEIQSRGKLIFVKRDWDKKTYICAGHTYKQFDFDSAPTASVYIIPDEEYKETNGFQWPHKDIDKIIKLYNDNGYDFVEFEQRTIDFTKPENFVKLFNLKVYEHECASTLAHMVTHDHCVNSTEEFIYYMVLMIENGRCSYNLAKLIKEQTWKYD